MPRHCSPSLWSIITPNSVALSALLSFGSATNGFKINRGWEAGGGENRKTRFVISEEKSHLKAHNREKGRHIGQGPTIVRQIGIFDLCVRPFYYNFIPSLAFRILLLLKSPNPIYFPHLENVIPKRGEDGGDKKQLFVYTNGK